MGITYFLLSSFGQNLTQILQQRFYKSQTICYTELGREEINAERGWFIDMYTFKARNRYGGWSLKVYQWEEQTYPVFRTIKIEKSKASAYLKKFARHFKVDEPKIDWSIKKRGGGHYTPSKWFAPLIALPSNPSLGLICHEFAHHLDARRHPETPQWHGKSFRRELKRTYTFAKRYLPKEIATPPEVAN